MYTFQSVQRFPVSIIEAWDFFSNPDNLKTITPPYMGFEITDGYIKGQNMEEGMLIEYKVKPLLGLPLTWLTEITHCDAPHSFTDEQRKGPYKIWQHDHFFRSIKGGVEMTDSLRYALYGGVAGKMINKLIVHQKIRDIFSYRRLKLEEIFGRYTPEEDKRIQSFNKDYQV